MFLMNTPSKPGGGAFSPSGLTGLIGWWKADAGTSSTTNGADVATWASQAAGGIGTLSAASGGAGSPKYDTTDALNSLPVLDFHSVAAMGSGSFSLGGSTLSVFAVLKPTATSAGRLFGLNIAGTDNGADGGALLVHPDTNSLLIQRNGSKAVGTIVGGAWNKIGAVFDGTNCTCYVANVGGTPVASTGTFNATPTAFDIMAAAGLGGNLVTGFLAEMIVMSAAAGSTDRSNIDTYFSSRYGI